MRSSVTNIHTDRYTDTLREIILYIIMISDIYTAQVSIELLTCAGEKFKFIHCNTVNKNKQV